MGSVFHQLCPRYSGTLTPTSPTAKRLWKSSTFYRRVKVTSKVYMNPSGIYSFFKRLNVVNTSIIFRKMNYRLIPSNIIVFICLTILQDADTVFRIILDVDECESDPCLNGATCMNTYGGYKCMCVPGFTGKKCGTGKYPLGAEHPINIKSTMIQRYDVESSLILF